MYIFFMCITGIQRCVKVYCPSLLEEEAQRASRTCTTPEAYYPPAPPAGQAEQLTAQPVLLTLAEHYPQD